MKRSVLLFLAIPFLLLNCKKEDPGGDPAPQPDFTRLGIGNYWIYEFYRVDTNGVETRLAETDSCHILKDSVIGNVTYFVRVSDPFRFEKSGGPLVPLRYSDTALVRDSAGYLLRRYADGSQVIEFSRDDFARVLFSDSIGTLLYEELRMTGKDSVIEVPAGSFVTRTACLVCYPLEPTYPWGIRKFPYSYGRNAGLVKYAYAFYSSPIHYEGRLMRSGTR
jgi:hypothetical protein